MGGQGSGRKPDPVNLFKRGDGGFGDDSRIVIPNLSGVKEEAKKTSATDITGGSAPEGTAVKSTGETGGTKFLREDGDGTSSWQNIPDDYIKNDADDTSTGKITAANFAVTGDNNTNDSEYVPMVLHGTDATPPTASTVPRGTIYIQYTA